MIADVKTELDYGCCFSVFFAKRGFDSTCYPKSPNCEERLKIEARIQNGRARHSIKEWRLVCKVQAAKSVVKLFAPPLVLFSLSTINMLNVERV